jgi:hypothetical protein
MNTKFIDPEEMRKAVEEETLTVKTGVRAGQGIPPIVCYGVKPITDPVYYA